MSSNYPTGLDAFTRPSQTDTMSTSGVEGDVVIDHIFDALEAIESKIGIDSSTDTDSIDYQLSGVGTNDKAASLTGSETLSNKTMTGAVINSSTITGGTVASATITSPTITGATISTTTLTSPTINTPTINTPTFTGLGFTAWTPTFSNFDIGNGTINIARYFEVGTIVHGYLKVTLGSSSAVTGAITFSAPTDISSSYPTGGQAGIGLARFDDTSVAAYTGLVDVQSGNLIRFLTHNASGTYTTIVAVTSAIPFTFASGDSFACNFTYERS